MTELQIDSKARFEVKHKTLVIVAIIAILLTMQVAAHAQSAIAATQDAKTAPVEVKIDNFSFTPATITVPAGTTVRWTNRDDIPHTVVSDDQKFRVEGAGHRRSVLVHLHQGRARTGTSARSIPR